MDHLDTFGKRLRAARLAAFERRGKEIRQSDIAELLDVRGATVSTWEGDQYVPTLDVMLKLADVLGVTPGWLAFGQEPRYRQPEDDTPAPIAKRKRAESAEEKAAREAAEKRATPRKRRAL